MKEYLVLSDCEVKYLGNSLKTAKLEAKKSWNKEVYEIKRLK